MLNFLQLKIFTDYQYYFNCIFEKIFRFKFFGIIRNFEMIELQKYLNVLNEKKNL
jgi:hypothetical protein